MIVSQEHYIWFVTAVTFGTSASWLVVDIVRLRRALAERDGMPDGPDQPSRHDRVFGSLIGLVVAAIGIAGVLRYHLG